MGRTCPRRESGTRAGWCSGRRMDMHVMIPADPRSYHPCVFLYERKASRVHIDVAFFSSTWRSREQKIGVPVGRAQCSDLAWIQYKTIHHSSLIWDDIDEVLECVWMHCICACTYMLWRGNNLPRGVRVIFWIQIEWMGWLLQENRMVTSQ